MDNLTVESLAMLVGRLQLSLLDAQNQIESLKRQVVDLQSKTSDQVPTGPDQNC